MKTLRSPITALEILTSICAIRLLKKRIPIYCEWEITNHCNMRCDFCSTQVNDRNSTEDISTDEAIDIINQLSEIGTKIVHFSGGEPMLRDDLPQLITAAKEKGMIVCVTTNGSAAYEKFKRILNTDIIRISIDGTQGFHDNLRKTPGAFQKAIDSLRFLAANGAKPQVNTVYMPESSYEMLASLVGIIQQYNAQMTINALNKNINDDTFSQNHYTKSRLDSSFFTEYIQVVERLKRKYGNIVINPEPLITIIKKGGLDVFGCRVMDIAISIKNDGGVNLPCNCLPIKHVKGSIKEIYYGKDALRLKTLQGGLPACKGCYVKCMCMASALLKTRSLIAIIGTSVRNLF